MSTSATSSPDLWQSRHGPSACWTWKSSSRRASSLEEAIGLSPSWSASMIPTASEPVDLGRTHGRTVQEVGQIEIVHQRVGDIDEDVRQLCRC